MADANDEYGMELEAQGQALNSRQRAIDEDREKWTAAVMHYIEFLRSKGRPVPSFATEIAKPKTAEMVLTPPYDGVSRVVRYAKPRIGEKRKQVLLYIAKATREGRRVTTQEIIDKTGVPQYVANNVVWKDSMRGMLARMESQSGKFHEYQMTKSGFEILKKAEIDV